MAAALGLPFDFEVKAHRGSAIRFITADHAGTISSIDVPDNLCHTEGVEEIELYLKPGDSIETPHSSNDRTCRMQRR